MIDTGDILALGALLFVKHLLADGPLQTSYQVSNKGRFLHPAGLTHAGTHVLLSLVAIALWPQVAEFGGYDVLRAQVGLVVAILVAEFVIHYFVDLTKCRLDRFFQFSKPGETVNGRRELIITHTGFFQLFLIDQTCHSLTYIAMMYEFAEALA